METKIYVFVLITLIIGLVGGYFVSTVFQPSDSPELSEEINAKNEKIATLQTEVQNIENQIDARNEQIATLQIDIQSLNSQIASKNSQITSLQIEVQALNEIVIS